MSERLNTYNPSAFEVVFGMALVAATVAAAVFLGLPILAVIWSFWFS